MTTLNTRSKDAIVAVIAAGMQGRVAAFLNFAVGSVFRALAEAYAGVCLWLQAETLKVLALTRAATSDGADLDTWMADYGLARLAARSATGLVTFGRYTASGSAPVVPVGAIVQTGDGSQKFAVYADPTNGAYSASQGGYVLLAGASTVSAPVTAVIPGTDGNVSAGAISLIGSAMPGIDVVSNPAGFTNGLNAEADADLRARFVLFINALAQATVPAIGAAITGLGQGLRYQILDGIRPDGVAQAGYVTVYVDDGSGAPSVSLVAAAGVAVNATRAAGVQAAVLGASPLGASVQMTIEIAAGYYQPDVVAAVTAALSVYINELGLGVKLRYTRLEQVAYDASPGVTNVTAVTLNGAVLDLIPPAGRTVKVSSLVVTPAI